MPMPLTGEFWSEKLQRQVAYHSLISADFLYYLEFFPQFVWYTETVKKIVWELNNGEIHTYTPDFLVILNNGFRIIIEIKPEDKVDDDGTIQQRTIGREWAEANQHGFLLVSSDDLRKRNGHILHNLVHIYGSASLYVSALKLGKILSVLRANKQLTIAELSAQVADENEGLMDSKPAILHCIFKHFVAVNLSEKISNHSLVWIPSGDEDFSINFMIGDE